MTRPWRQVVLDVGTDIPDSTFLALVRAGIVDYSTGCAMTTHDLIQRLRRLLRDQER
jgi:hypothetical protein